MNALICCAQDFGVMTNVNTLNKSLPEPLIYRTDIGTKKKAKAIGAILDAHPLIVHWSVDTEDIDKVLRIVVSKQLNEGEIVEIMAQNGVQCEPLPD